MKLREGVCVHGFFTPSKEEHLPFTCFAFLNAPEILFLFFGELKSSRNKQLQWKQQESYCLMGEFQWLLALLTVVGERAAKWKGCLSWSLLRSLGFQKDDKNWVRIQKDCYRKCFSMRKILPT